VRSEGLDKLKKFIHLVGSRTTTLPFVLSSVSFLMKICKFAMILIIRGMYQSSDCGTSRSQISLCFPE
jgi:hypothetical protein